uniref:Uncharacterized protein n=1 Tax=Octopus bimaculoides TaxID=37653 RepID=A0A0L8G7Q9_OCTBM
MTQTIYNECSKYSFIDIPISSSKALKLVLYFMIINELLMRTALIMVSECIIPGIFGTSPNILLIIKKPSFLLLSCFREKF